MKDRFWPITGTKFNMDDLKRITERVNKNGDFYMEGTPIPMLTMDEFFEGNDVIGSIGCNLDGAPHPSIIESGLKKIKERSDVTEVYIQITEMDDPDWPFSDTAWVITTASENTIKECFPDNLVPDEVWEGFIEGNIYETIEIPDGFKALACWWD